ncbi:MAG: hypothetical protein R3A78_10875 [Polyangiales bacterium]
MKLRIAPFLLVIFALAACGGGDGKGSTGDAGAQSDAQASDGGQDGALTDGGDAGSDAAMVVLEPGIIAPTPYLSSADSPFGPVNFPSYFHLEDFEDGLLNTPGVSADVGVNAKQSYPSIADSVDGDDGDATDGTCTGCDDWFYSSGATGINFTFDSSVLGQYPTHAGIVWTDGGYNCSVTFTAYDANDDVIYSDTFEGIGDNSNNRETAEDRFFGVVSPVGVKRLFISNTGGGIEVDHLQYGR